MNQIEKKYIPNFKIQIYFVIFLSYNKSEYTFTLFRELDSQAFEKICSRLYTQELNLTACWLEKDKKKLTLVSISTIPTVSSFSLKRKKK